MRRVGLCFAAFAGWVLGLGAASAPAVAANKVHGATVNDEYRRAGEDRFRSNEDWEKTVRFFRSAYGGKPGYVWHAVDTPPKVKAIHIENTHPGRTWEGINIYETNNEIYVFVIKAEGKGKRK